MTRCIIHIGMHKTGSTSIQQSLDGFSDDRFLYARLGSSANHTFAICGMFTQDPAEHLRLLTRGRFDPREYDARMPADLEHALQEARGRTLIISGEGIGHLPRQLDLARMRTFFRERVDQLTIVGYVRPPVGFVTSAIQQRLRSGRSTRLQPARFYPSYEDTFSRFDDVFGRENVHLRKFDPSQFPNGCVVQDFCGRLGIPLLPKRIVRVNDSLPREALTLLYTYFKRGEQNGAAAMKGRDIQQLCMRLQKIGRDKVRFSPDLMRPVLEKNRADIEWMETRLGQSLYEELGEPRPGDVRSEADLLEPRPEAVSELRALLGKRAPAGVTGKTVEEVARLVHALRGKDASKHKPEPLANPPPPEASERRQINRHGETGMKVAELIAEIQKSNPQLLNGIPEERAEALVEGVFKQMNDVLAKTEDGALNFPGLGRFRVKQVDRDVDGKKVVRTLINFRRTEPGSRRRNAGGRDADLADEE